MPGISFIYNKEGNFRHKSTEYISKINKLKYTSRYQITTLQEIDPFYLFLSHYSEYPYTEFNFGNSYILLEGCIYNRSSEELKKELKDLSFRFFNNTPINKKFLSDWIKSIDGEFVIFCYDKNLEKIIIINDLMGHLPLYYKITPKEVIISRDIKLIQELSPSFPDKMVIAQYLLFSFPLGNNTLFQEIFRLEAGSFISIDLKNSNETIFNFHRFNFQQLNSNHSKSIKENVKNLCNLFNMTCKNRVKSFPDYKNILSLSGGFDSRAVFASLNTNNIPFDCVTFIDDNKIYSKDINISQQLANDFNLSWELLELQKPKGKDIIQLLDSKFGQNNINMAFLITFFQKIEDKFGAKVNYFSGNTGMSLRSYLPTKKIRNFDELIEYIFSFEGKYNMIHNFSLDEVSALLDLNKLEIIRNIKKIIEKYPETDFKFKYMHFLYYGYCFNWHYEGIDRNIFYFWNSSPLESTPFFLYAMNCLDSQKKNKRLFSEFIISLCPQVSKYPISNYNSRLKSRKMKLNLTVESIFTRIPVKLKKIIYKFKGIQKTNYIPLYPDLFNQQVSKSKLINNYFNIEYMQKISKTKQQFHVLFTITNIIEYSERNHYILEDFLNKNLI